MAKSANYTFFSGALDLLNALCRTGDAEQQACRLSYMSPAEREAEVKRREAARLNEHLQEMRQVRNIAKALEGREGKRLLERIRKLQLEKPTEEEERILHLIAL